MATIDRPRILFSTLFFNIATQNKCDLLDARCLSRCTSQAGADFPSGEVNIVEEGGSVTFNGKVVGREVDQVYTLFRNAGNME